MSAFPFAAGTGFRPNEIRSLTMRYTHTLIDDRVKVLDALPPGWIGHFYVAWALVDETLDSGRLGQLNDMAESLFAGYRSALRNRPYRASRLTMIV